jgi:protein-disulfide isomerase
MAMLKVPVTPDDHIRGNEHAPVTLVEYGDYECPHCGIAYYTIKSLQKHYGQLLRFVFRNFPLAEIHPHAESAAEAAEFAADYGRFWEMHDGIYENQPRLDTHLLFELASLLALPAAGLRRALMNQEYASKIGNDFLGGVRSGVSGTPAFFINNVRHDGSYEFGDLASAIDTQLWQLKDVA